MKLDNDSFKKLMQQPSLKNLEALAGEAQNLKKQMAKKMLLVFLPGIAVFSILLLALISCMGGGGSGAYTPVSVFATEDKSIEYAEVCSKMGAPWDIVMLTDAIIADSQDLSGIEEINPIFTAFEFLHMDIIKEKLVVISYELDEDTGEFTYETGWEYAGRERISGQQAIFQYLGIDPLKLDWTADNITERAQEIVSANDTSDIRYYVNFATNSDYEAVLRDFLHLTPQDVERIIELYSSDYISLWLPEEVRTKIEKIKISNGLYQNSTLPEILPNYEGLVFTDGAVDIVYYNQADKRWANKIYGNASSSDIIGTHGCGPTAMAIVISSLTDTMVDPVYMANWAVENGHWAPGNGSYRTLIGAAAEAFGLSYSEASVNEPERVINALNNGHLVVVLVGRGTFTTSGHFIVLRGVTSNGQVLVADPISHYNSNKTWGFTSPVLRDTINNGVPGGPFWIIYNEKK